MTRSSQLALAACLLVLGIGMLFMWNRLSTDRPLTPLPVANTRDHESAGTISVAQWRQMLARLEALEQQTGETAPGDRMPVDKDKVDVSALGEMRSRIEKLEAELAALRDQLAGMERLDKVESISGLKSAIRELELNDQNAIADRAKKRIALRALLLERYPEDSDAARQLERLAGEQLETDPKQALADLDRFASRVAIDPWTRDSTYANVLFFNGRLEEADQRYQHVIHAVDTPERERWAARFNAAYMYMMKGLYDEARQRFEAMIAEAGDNPEAARFVGGANAQLALIEQYTKKK